MDVFKRFGNKWIITPSTIDTMPGRIFLGDKIKGNIKFSGAMSVKKNTILKIGDMCHFGQDCIHNGNLRIGREVRLGDNVNIGSDNVLGSHTNIGCGFVSGINVKIRRRCRIGDGVTIHAGVYIGNNSIVEYGAVILMRSLIGEFGKVSTVSTDIGLITIYFDAYRNKAVCVLDNAEISQMHIFTSLANHIPVFEVLEELSARYGISKPYMHARINIEDVDELTRIKKT